MGISNKKLYTGIDVVEIDRLKSIFEKYHLRFLNKVFTKEEQAFSKNNPERLATRFAAKEATMKALGLKHKRVPWCSIEVKRAVGTPPEIRLHKEALSEFQKLNISVLSLSLSHTSKTAVAMVVALAE